MHILEDLHIGLNDLKVLRQQRSSGSTTELMVLFIQGPPPKTPTDVPVTVQEATLLISMPSYLWNYRHARDFPDLQILFVDVFCSGLYVRPAKFSPMLIDAEICDHPDLLGFSPMYGVCTSMCT